MAQQEHPPVLGSSMIVFFCHSCGMRLSIDRSKAGASGPCPRCATWLTSPVGNQDERLPPPAGPAVTKDRAAQRERKKMRVIPDANVDRAELDRREMTRILWIIALVGLVLSLCVGVAWYLKNWQLH